MLHTSLFTIHCYSMNLELFLFHSSPFTIHCYFMNFEPIKLNCVFYSHFTLHLSQVFHD